MNKQEMLKLMHLLERGEKYEHMWGELVGKVYSQQSSDNDNITYCDLLELKQKYFPKE